MSNLKTSDFYYDLPEELIAQTPAEPRDSSRMLVYDRALDTISHEHFYDITNHLQKGDLLVINNTRVIPARIFGHIDGKQTTFEILLLKRLDYTHWEGIMRPARKARVGSVIKISDELTATVEEVGEYGIRTISFQFDGVFEDILDRVGNMPLPPYIHEVLEDKERYQTVYSKTDGSAAAPTAGLHFTEELMQKAHCKILEILTIFDDLCKKLNLKYTLSSGTLLGAVRHKGFIPWDDDVDVAMPREDYEIFVKNANSMLPDGFFLQHYTTDKHYMHIFAKLKNSNTTWIESGIGPKKNMNHGIYIDIFPIDSLKDPKKLKGYRRKTWFLSKIKSAKLLFLDLALISCVGEDSVDLGFGISHRSVKF